MTVVYDAGMLIAADRGESAAWALHFSFLRHDVKLLTTAPVVAQASRSPRQRWLRKLLSTCEVVDFTGRQAHPVGELLRSAGTADAVDAHVVLVAHAAGASVVSSDRDDLEALASCLSPPPHIRDIP